MLRVFQKIFAFMMWSGAVCLSQAQETTPPQKPQVKVNVLNVCTPSAEEQGEISGALGHIPKHPSFSPDFEIDRGRSIYDPNANPLGTGSGMNGPQPAVVTQQASAQFVRIRHDLEGGQAFSSVQYSFSRDSQDMVETLVFRVREPKDLLEISIESSASAVTTPAAMLATSTPANRIKLERFGKSSIVLARCSGGDGGSPVDQHAYEPLFSSASSVLMNYRGLLDARKLVPEELTRMGTGSVHHKTAASVRHP